MVRVPVSSVAMGVFVFVFEILVPVPVIVISVPAFWMSAVSASLHSLEKGGEDRGDRRADDFGEERLINAEKHGRNDNALHVRSEKRQRLRTGDERRESGGISQEGEGRISGEDVGLRHEPESRSNDHRHRENGHET